MRGHSTSSPRVVGNREVVPPARQCAAACGIIRQRISASTSNSCVVSCAIFSRCVSTSNSCVDSCAMFSRYVSTSNSCVVSCAVFSRCVSTSNSCVVSCAVFSRCVSTSNSCVVSCAMFSRFVTLRLFLIPTTDTSTDSPSLCWQSDHSDGRSKTALRHSGKCFPGLFQRPPATLEAVYWCRRKIFRRRSSAPKCSTPYSFLYHHLPTFRAQFVNVGRIVQFMDTRQTLWLKVEVINHKPIAFKICQICNCRMTHQVPPCFVQHCSTNATPWGATERQNTRVAAWFESEEMNCGSKQTGLLILSWRCVGLPQRRTSERTSFLQQSKQLRVELQNLILCSGGHSLWYNQHITGANIRTCPGCLQQSVCPPSQLYVSVSRA